MGLCQNSYDAGAAACLADLGFEKKAFIGVVGRGLWNAGKWAATQGGIAGTKSWQLGMQGMKPVLRTGGEFPGWWTAKSGLNKGLTTAGGVGLGGAYAGGKVMEGVNEAQAAPHLTRTLGQPWGAPQMHANNPNNSVAYGDFLQ